MPAGAVTRKFATLRGYVGRGVITTATYEARKFGLHSALGLMKAAALAPDCILLPTDFEAYRRYSRLFKAAVARHRAAHRGPRHRRDLHRPDRRARRPGADVALARRGRGLRQKNPRSTPGGAPATSPRRSRTPCATPPD